MTTKATNDDDDDDEDDDDGRVLRRRRVKSCSRALARGGRLKKFRVGHHGR